jgi:hypothetical protein
MCKYITKKNQDAPLACKALIHQPYKLHYLYA